MHLVSESADLLADLAAFRSYLQLARVTLIHDYSFSTNKAGEREKKQPHFVTFNTFHNLITKHRSSWSKN